MKHTPTPYHMNGHTLIRSSDVLVAAAEFADVSIETALATAKFIVRACNSHDDLLESCETLLLVVEAETNIGEFSSEIHDASEAIAAAKVEGE